MLLIKWSENNGPEQTLDFDCSVNEGYESAAEVTEHAVERGANVTDHVRPKNDTISLECVITNTPLDNPTFGLDGATGSVGSHSLEVGGKKFNAQTWGFSQAFDRVARADTQLRALKSAGQVLTVIAHGSHPARIVRTISDAVITRYKWDRAAESGNSLMITLELSRIRIATTQRVDAVPRRRSGRQQQARGTQPAVQEDRSVLAGAADALGVHL